MRRIHDGTGMGFVWQLILFLAESSRRLLAVTGIIMWWRARDWRCPGGAAGIDALVSIDQRIDG
ncbi:MAG: hypothetical protein WDN44_05115 [Sphingomonas sp.]